MAEGGDEWLSDIVTCSVCFEVVANKKSLPCKHVFCASCLANIIQNRRIRCPNCRYETHLDDRGLDGLETIYVVDNLMPTSPNNKPSCDLCSTSEAKWWCGQCNDNMCDPCKDNHDEAANLAEHQVVDIDFVCSTYAKAQRNWQKLARVVNKAAYNVLANVAQAPVDLDPTNRDNIELVKQEIDEHVRAEINQIIISGEKLKRQLDVQRDQFNVGLGFPLSNNTPTMNTGQSTSISSDTQTANQTTGVSMSNNTQGQAGAVRLPQLGDKLWEAQVYDYGDVTFLPDGRLAVACWNQKVVLYSSDGRKLDQYKPSFSLRCIVYHPHTGTLIGGGGNKIITMKVGDNKLVREKTVTLSETNHIQGMCVLQDGSIATAHWHYWPCSFMTVRTTEGRIISRIDTPGIKPYNLCAQSDCIYVTNHGGEGLRIYNLRGQKLHDFTKDLSKYCGVATDHQGYIWLCDSDNQCLTVLNKYGRIIKKHQIDMRPVFIAIQGDRLCVAGYKQGTGDKKLSVYRI